MPVVSCSGWSNDAITWGNLIRYADSVQTNTNSNQISSLLTLDPRFEGVRIQCADTVRSVSNFSVMKVAVSSPKSHQKSLDDVIN